MLVLLAGLPATGKTTLANELAKATQGHVLDKDPIRSAVFGPNYVEYSVAQDDFVQQMMLESARWLLTQRPQLPLFLTGRTFSRRYQLDAAARVAEGLNQPFFVLHCVVSDEVARQRLQMESAHPARNRSFELYLQVKAEFQPIQRPSLLVDTAQPLAQCVAMALNHIRWEKT